MTWPRLWLDQVNSKARFEPMFLPPNPVLFFYYIKLTALWSVTAALYSVRDGLCWRKFFLSLYPLQCFWIINADFSSISRLCFSTWPKKMTDTITTYSPLCFLKFWNQDNDTNNIFALLLFIFSILFNGFPNSIIVH